MREPETEQSDPAGTFGIGIKGIEFIGLPMHKAAYPSGEKRAAYLDV